MVLVVPRKSCFCEEKIRSTTSFEERRDSVLKPCQATLIAAAAAARTFLAELEPQELKISC
jgi:hypothetical protein